MINRLLPLSLAVTAAIYLSACKTRPVAVSGPAPTEVRPEDVLKANEFFAAGGKSGFHPTPENTPKLSPQTSAYVVDLDAQRVYLYDSANLIAVSQLSSGKKSYRTETGNYYVGERDLNHRSTLYGSFVNKSGSTITSDVTNGFDPTPVGGRFQGALMKYFQRFHLENGSPTATGFHQGVLPGYPASHGCVRLPATMAGWFFNNVPQGTPIYVRGTKYGVPHGTKQARPKRAPKVHSSLKKKPEEAAPKELPKGEEGSPVAPPAPTPDPAPSAPEPAPAPPTDSSAAPATN